MDAGLIAAIAEIDLQRGERVAPQGGKAGRLQQGKGGVHRKSVRKGSQRVYKLSSANLRHRPFVESSGKSLHIPMHRHRGSSPTPPARMRKSDSECGGAVSLFASLWHRLPARRIEPAFMETPLRGILCTISGFLG
jgi:hypothetical protein